MILSQCEAGMTCQDTATSKFSKKAAHYGTIIEIFVRNLPNTIPTETGTERLVM